MILFVAIVSSDKSKTGWSENTKLARDATLTTQLQISNELFVSEVTSMSFFQSLYKLDE